MQKWQFTQLPLLLAPCTVSSAACLKQSLNQTYLFLLSAPSATWGPLYWCAQFNTESSRHPRLQTLDNKASKAMTADEFVELLKIVRARAEEIYATCPKAFGRKLRYSFDGASYHVAALQFNCLAEGSLHRPPARSPDLHKVPEACIRRVKAAFRREFTRDLRVRTPEQALRLLQEIAKKKLKPVYVRNLIRSLPKTFASVVANKGNWADKKFR